VDGDGAREGQVGDDVMSPSTMNARDAMPSWNDGATKAAILEFVELVSRPGASYVAPADRIATFDNDRPMKGSRSRPSSRP